MVQRQAYVPEEAAAFVRWHCRFHFPQTRSRCWTIRDSCGRDGPAFHYEEADGNPKVGMDSLQLRNWRRGPISSRLLRNRAWSESRVSES
jgi:hypothetical protein